MLTFTLGPGKTLNTTVVELMETKATIVCKLPCFSKDILCKPLSVTLTQEKTLEKMTNYTLAISGFTGDRQSYSYPSQNITVTDLTRGNSYMLCVETYNFTTRKLLGDKVCLEFTTPHHHNRGIVV